MAGVGGSRALLPVAGRHRRIVLASRRRLTARQIRRTVAMNRALWRMTEPA